MKILKSNSVSNEILEEVERAKLSKESRNELIKNYMPFIIKSISEVTKSYVRVGDSDELSVGLMAFNEAIDRYQGDKGLFLSYAKLVIKSRIKNYIEQNQSGISTVPIEEIDIVRNIALSNKDDNGDLKEEIIIWKDELLKFNITFSDLLSKKPKHKDSKDRAFNIAREVSDNKSIVDRMFEKYKLPISLISRELKVSMKILEGGKVFIISVVIIFTKKLGAIRRWIQWD